VEEDCSGGKVVTMVKFIYQINGTDFQSEIDVDDWQDLDQDERLDLLREHALGEVDDVLQIDESSINDD